MSTEIVVTFVAESELLPGVGLMILAHPSGCVEVLNAALVDFPALATAELDFYLRGGEVSHNACEIACSAGRHPGTQIIEAASVYAAHGDSGR